MSSLLLFIKESSTSSRGQRLHGIVRAHGMDPHSINPLSEQLCAERVSLYALAKQKQATCSTDARALQLKGRCKAEGKYQLLISCSCDARPAFAFEMGADYICIFVCGQARTGSPRTAEKA